MKREVARSRALSLLFPLAHNVFQDLGDVFLVPEKGYYVIKP